MTQKSIFRITLGCLILFASSACLTVETMTVTMLFNQDATPATVVLEYFNIYSDEKTVEALQEDFELLIQSVEGPEYVKEMAESGLAVKDRELKIVDGKIVGRMTAEITNAEVYFRELKMTVSDTDRRCIINTKEEKLLTTNGAIERTEETTTVVWPLTEKKIFYTVQFKDQLEHKESGQALWVKKFEDHLNNKKHATESK